MNSQSILSKLKILFNHINHDSRTQAQIQDEIDDLYANLTDIQNNKFIFFWRYIFAKLFNYYLKCFMSDKIKDAEFKKRLKIHKELKKKNKIKLALKKKYRFYIQSR